MRECMQNKADHVIYIYYCKERFQAKEESRLGGAESFSPQRCGMDAEIYCPELDLT